MDKKVIIANWKMYPSTLAEAEGLYHWTDDACLANGKKTSVIVCPPFVYLSDLSSIKTDIELGAQDCHWEDEGAFTGEVSPAMIRNLKIKYVVVGHSERRWKLNETDEMINKKIKAVLRNKMEPILAIGEKEREGNYQEITIGQLEKALEGVEPEDVKDIIFVYEPVWAIGSGLSDKPEDTIEAVNLIRDFLNTRYQIQDTKYKILYGGSVNSKNVADFISRPEIDGVLVGGASVDREEFKKIIEIASNV